jgi:hypothetical protein
VTIQDTTQCYDCGEFIDENANREAEEDEMKKNYEGDDVRLERTNECHCCGFDKEEDFKQAYHFGYTDGIKKAIEILTPLGWYFKSQEQQNKLIEALEKEMSHE